MGKSCKDGSESDGVFRVPSIIEMGGKSPRAPKGHSGGEIGPWFPIG